MCIIKDPPHAGRHEKNPPAHVRSQARGHIMSGFFDAAFPPQVIIERMVHVRVAQAEKNVNSRRLDIRIHDADPSISGGD